MSRQVEALRIMTQGKTGQRDEALEHQLDQFYEELTAASEQVLGYPCNLAFDYEPLYRFLRFATNNIGDPLSGSNYQVNTRAIERKALQFFAELLHLPWPQAWGYVTSGGTEGNTYGLFLARELYPHGILYFSQDTHYSIRKIAKLLNLRNIMIRSLPSGEIDYQDLEASIAVKREHPVILCANIGTTMKGAIDDLDRVQQILERLAIEDCAIHCDAALSGMILPFVDDPPLFDFRARINSIAISGHKMIGSPLPCGVVLARRSLVRQIERSIEYVGILDTTLSGSRSGFTPLLLWYAIRRHGRQGWRRMVQQTLRMTETALQRLQEIGWPAWRNPHSNTIVIRRPSDELVRRWQLAVTGEIAHLIVMPHLTLERIEPFLEELQQEGSGVREQRPADE
jgi:histidine decarboxylase